MKLKSFLLIVLLGLSEACAQTALPNASTAFPILSVGMGARAVGMGEGFTGIADDLSALHYNPAGLAQLRNPGLTATHNSYLAEGFYEMLGGVYPVVEGGTLGMGFHYLNYGSFEQRDSQGLQRGSYTPYDLGVQCAFGFTLDRNLFLGLSSEWVRQDIGGVAHSGSDWGAGFLYKPSSHLSFGVNLGQVGLETGTYRLPSELSFGAAFRPDLSRDETHSLILCAGGAAAFQDVSRLNVGFEYGFQKSYFIRGGYSADLADNQLGGVKGLDLGAGLKLDNIQFDYAFSTAGDLGNLHRFSLCLWFPRPEKPLGPAPEAAFPMTPPFFDNSEFFPPGNDGKKPVVLKFQVKSEEGLTAQELFAQAEAKQKAGLKQEALELYLKAVNKDPHLEKAWVNLGRLYFDKSLETYRKVLEMDPHNEKLRQWLRHFR